MLSRLLIVALACVGIETWCLWYQFGFRPGTTFQIILIGSTWFGLVTLLFFPDNSLVTALCQSGNASERAAGLLLALAGWAGILMLSLFERATRYVDQDYPRQE